MSKIDLRTENGLVTINELLGETFFVDAYQRGYKWTDQEVRDLLEDIQAFTQEAENDFYCLQPIVVKRVEKEIKGSIKEVWELIDGQQRLTTIYMILRVIREKGANFFIHYRTRKESAVFLEKFVPSETEKSWEAYLKTKPKFDEIGTVDNIDNYHFFNAFQTISAFFSGKDIEDNFSQKLLNQVQIIWYKPDIKLDNEKQEDSRSIFTRINAGKIPLTQAELLKAWCIQNSGNEANANYLAVRWEEIERQLRVPEFRYFLGGTSGDGNSNWITLLLEDFAGTIRVEDRKKLFHILTQNQGVGSGFALFLRFELLYQSTLDWFADNEMYNLVGWLRSITSYQLTTIHDEYSKQTQTKFEFKEWIKGLIRSSLNEVDPEGLQYGESNDAIRRVLFSFNVLTHCGTELKYRFPFDEYKTRAWDIEHIHALATGIPDTVETLLEWTKSYHSPLEKLGTKDDDLKLEVAAFQEKLESTKAQGKTDNPGLQNLKQEFGQLQVKVIQSLGGGTMNQIENLALLNADVNRSIKNIAFVEKRDRIKAHVDGGNFMPPATLRVFFKYYSNGTSNSLIWADQDRKDYRIAMQNLFNAFGINTLNERI